MKHTGWILGGGAAVLGGAAAFLDWDNTRLTRTAYELTDRRFPVTDRPVCIVQLSDLHNRCFGAQQQGLLAATLAEKPDVVVLTGDLIDRMRSGMNNALTLADGLAAAGVLTVFTPGNHEAESPEYPRLRRQLLARGVLLLEDRTINVAAGNGFFTLAGLRDMAFFGPERKWQLVCRKMAPKNNEYCVLLSHRPDLFVDYVASGYALVLTGHAHGGQIRLPHLPGLYAPDQGPFPEYTAGIYRSGNTKMVVSRGLGDSLLAPLRVMNPPEMVVLHLSHAD